MAKLSRWPEYDPIRWKRVWRENHGSLLMLWALVVLLGGVGVIVYRQNRNKPAPFPHGSAVVQLDEAEPQVPESAQGAAIIRVTGAASDEGMVQVMVHDLRETYPAAGSAYLRVLLEVEDRQAIWAVPRSELPPSFALSAFHDENNDGALTRDRQGSPQERTAYSNQTDPDARPWPVYEQAVIPRPMPGETIELQLR